MLKKAKAHNSFTPQTEDKYRLYLSRKAMALFPDEPESSKQHLNNTGKQKSSQSFGLAVIVTVIIILIFGAFNEFTIAVIKLIANIIKLVNQ
jgi:hypothetical protein